jgi:hypothetical protein
LEKSGAKFNRHCPKKGSKLHKKVQHWRLTSGADPVALSAGGEACESIAASAVRNQSLASQGRSDRVQGREEDLRCGTSETTIRSSEVLAIGFKETGDNQKGSFQRSHNSSTGEENQSEDWPIREHDPCVYQ